jgi:oligoribonuclease
LARCNEWSAENHKESGLLDEVRASTVSVADAEEEVLRFINLHVPEFCSPVLAGSSIGKDRQFIDKVRVV